MLEYHKLNPNIFREATIHEYPNMGIGEHLLGIYERLGFYSETDPPETVFNEIFLELVTFVLDGYGDMGRNSSRLISRLDAVEEISTLLATYYPSSWLEDGGHHNPHHSNIFEGKSLHSIFFAGSEALPTQSYNTQEAEFAVQLYIAQGLESRAFELFLIKLCIFIPGINHALGLAQGRRPDLSAMHSFVHQPFVKKDLDGFRELKEPVVPTYTYLITWLVGLTSAYLGFELVGGTDNAVLAVFTGIACLLFSSVITLGPVEVIHMMAKVEVSEARIQIEDDARHLIQFYEKARVTSPLQNLLRLNHLNTRGFYFPAALENLLEYMNEQQTRDRHTAASYLLHGREMGGDSDT